jgi:hypothetical protein
MLSSLFPAKPKQIYANVIGELIILIPEIDEFGEEVDEGSSRSVVFACPLVLTVHELRRRVAGETGMPLKKMHMFYQGSLLVDDDFVPAAVFENLDGIEYDSDEETFRPRVCLQIYEHEEGPGEDVDESSLFQPSIETGPDMGIGIDPEEGSEEEGEGDDEEEERARIMLGSSKEMVEMDERQEAAYNLQMKAFDLKYDLEKIHCSKYYDALQKQGYSDLVCSS